MYPPNTYPNTDTMISPVLDALVLVAKQIQNVGPVYKELPEQAMEDGSVFFSIHDWQVRWDMSTSGLMVIGWTIEIHHVFARRNRLQDELARAQRYIAPWLLALSGLANTSLNESAITLSPQSGKFLSYAQSNQQYLALVHTVTVLTQFIVPR